MWHVLCISVLQEFMRTWCWFATILWTKGNINSLNLIYELRFKQRDTNMNVFSSINFKVIIFPNAKSWFVIFCIYKRRNCKNTQYYRWFQYSKLSQHCSRSVRSLLQPCPHQVYYITSYRLQYYTLTARCAVYNTTIVAISDSFTFAKVGPHRYSNAAYISFDWRIFLHWSKGVGEMGSFSNMLLTHTNEPKFNRVIFFFNYSIYALYVNIYM